MWYWWLIGFGIGYFITHITYFVLVLRVGIIIRLTPRDIYVCTTHSHIMSFIIWLIELAIIPLIVIVYDIYSIVEYVKWKKEYKKGEWK